MFFLSNHFCLSILLVLFLFNTRHIMKTKCNPSVKACLLSGIFFNGFVLEVWHKYSGSLRHWKASLSKTRLVMNVGFFFSSGLTGDTTEECSLSSAVRLLPLYSESMYWLLLCFTAFSYRWSWNRRNSSSLFPQAGVWIQRQARRVRSRHCWRTSCYREHRGTRLWNGRLHYTPA